jgi:hypothetical protein
MCKALGSPPALEIILHTPTDPEMLLSAPTENTLICLQGGEARNTTCVEEQLPVMDRRTGWVHGAASKRGMICGYEYEPFPCTNVQGEEETNYRWKVQREGS